MFVVTRDTLWNPGILETRSLPRRIFGRVMPLPRREIGGRDLARLIFEIQPLRYIVTLAPFGVAMLIWPELALPIAQAPLAMVILLAAVEMKVLRLGDEARAGVVDGDEAARRLDTLAFRGRAALRAIAANHDLREGSLQLVVEQSEMARVAPLTLVSVQSARPEPRLLDLSPRDRAALGALFDDDLTERDLAEANQREQVFLREVRIEARAVSGHARMAAYLAEATP